jgi:hypothetical protein
LIKLYSILADDSIVDIADELVIDLDFPGPARIAGWSGAADRSSLSVRFQPVTGTGWFVRLRYQRIRCNNRDAEPMG